MVSFVISTRKGPLGFQGTGCHYHYHPGPSHVFTHPSICLTLQSDNSSLNHVCLSLLLSVFMLCSDCTAFNSECNFTVKIPDHWHCLPWPTWSHDENVPVGTFSQDAKYVPISTYPCSFQQKLTLEAVIHWAFVIVFEKKYYDYSSICLAFLT